jgi:xanthine dehydrogenase accessory factor
MLAFNLNKDPKYDTGLVCGGSLEIFIEPILPVSTIYIFGAGHVGYNVYRVARIAGFEVVVADDREAYANRERFPDAREVYAEEFDEILSKLEPPESAFIVIATRGHRDDMKILRWAVGTEAHYIGMIGSKRKVITIYKTLEKEGVAQEKLDRVRSPIGLDIGATTPEEIAVSVVSELIAVRRNAESALPHMRLLRKLAEQAPAEDQAPAACAAPMAS